MKRFSPTVIIVETKLIYCVKDNYANICYDDVCVGNFGNVTTFNLLVTEIKDNKFTLNMSDETLHYSYYLNKGYKVISNSDGLSYLNGFIEWISDLSINDICLAINTSDNNLKLPALYFDDYVWIPVGCFISPINKNILVFNYIHEMGYQFIQEKLPLDEVIFLEKDNKIVMMTKDMDKCWFEFNFEIIQ